MWYLCMRSLAKTLLASIRAALRSGPKQGMPAALCQGVHRPQHQRVVGGDHGEGPRRGPWQSPPMARCPGSDPGTAHGVGSDAAVAGGGVNFFVTRGSPQALDDGVLPAAMGTSAAYNDDVSTSLVVEQPHAGEGHHHMIKRLAVSMTIVLDGTAGLNDVLDAGFSRPLHIIAEGEEGVGAAVTPVRAGDPGRRRDIHRWRYPGPGGECPPRIGG